MYSRLSAIALDLIIVVAFATVGRRNHAEGITPAGVLDTAWPFLVGAVVGHVLALALRGGAAALPTGVSVGVCAVVVGMALRRATGDGTDPAFVIVATLLLGALLLGWRLLVRRRRTAPDKA